MNAQLQHQPGAPHRAFTLSAYGSLALPLALAEIPILLYLPAFYAKELQLSASMVGLVFLLARFWDGFVDLFVGWLSDRPFTKLGRRKPWVVFGAPFLMISTWFLCNPPPGAGLIYLCIWAALFYAAFTAVKIPHISWGTELASDYVQRSRVMSFRETFSFLGNLLFALMPLLFLKKNAPLSDVLFLISAAVIFSVPIATLLIARFVKDPCPDDVPPPQLLRGFREVFRNTVMQRFIFAMLCQWVLIGVSNSVAVFALDVGLGAPNALFLIVFILYVTTLLTMPGVWWLSKRIDKHLLLIGGTLLHGLAMLAHVFIPSGQPLFIYPLWVVAGLGSAPLLIIPASMVADIVDDGELSTGERRPGAYVAVFNLVIKIGLAIGVGLSFLLLDLVGFKAGATVYSAADAINIRLICFAIPAVLAVLEALIMINYPLTRRRQRQIRDELDNRSGRRVRG